MNEEERLELYTSIVPNERQLNIQKMPFYAFVHYSINTFTGKEWGNGKESPRLFNPKCQDTDSWCKAIKSAGMKGVVLTCKHHDGFCFGNRIDLDLRAFALKRVTKPRNQGKHRHRHRHSQIGDHLSVIGKRVRDDAV